MSDESSRLIDSQLQPLFGLPCWGLHHAPQLNLSLNFGPPSLEIREPRVAAEGSSEAIRQHLARRQVTVHGKWWLWLRLCYWRLDLHGERLATGSSSNRRIELALFELSGQKLVSVRVDSETGATSFEFDLGCRLNCRRFSKDAADELWVLYRPQGDVVSVYGDGTMGLKC